ncbi:MAG: MGMT family protein [Dethiobacter sp.]|jgi:methylated-DNA-protein-cysteine methyltransferase-like protein|nr:MGMT family protein [Dethiobacter sp.]
MKGFYHQVYEMVAAIPAGRVATYGQIASLLGKPQGGRAVGWAMRAVPADLKLPSHRVVNKQGALAPVYAFGSQERQRRMLAGEGITFDKNGRVNVEQHLWDGV